MTDENKVFPIDITCRDCMARPDELCRHITSCLHFSIKGFHRSRKQDARALSRGNSG